MITEVPNNVQLIEAKDLMSFTTMVTPAQAQHWLDKCNYPYNRPISRRQVDILKRAIEAGEFNQGSAVYFGVYSGREYLLDGQHRLTAIIETGIGQDMTIVYQQVDAFDKMAYMYARFDRQVRRNSADTFHAFNLEERTGLTRRQISKADYATRLILCGFSLSAKNGKNDYYRDFEIMNSIEHYQDQIRIFYNLIDGSSTKMRDAMLRRSTLSIALITLEEAVKHVPGNKVYEFWQRTADGNGLKNNDPRFQLRDRLLTTRISGGDNRGKTQQLSLLDACRMVVVAWNAYIDGKSISRFNLPSAALPVKLTSHIIPAKVA